MDTITLEPFGQDIVFGEGMRWHGGRVWLSDMLGRKVLAYSEDGSREVMAEVPPRPNGLGFLPDGRLLITSMADCRLLRLEADGALTPHADLGALMTGYCGDMAVDSLGNAYVDDVGFRVFEGDARRPGRLIQVAPDGQARIVDEGLMFPNGMWLTRDETRLVVAEGRARVLHVYDRAGDGTLSNRRPFAQLDYEVIDGLTLDAEGAAWVCIPHDHQLVRVEEGGRITHRVDLGDWKPIACCLGGADLRTLYLVSADYDLDRMARDDTGAVLHRGRVEVPGF